MKIEEKTTDPLSGPKDAYVAIAKYYIARDLDKVFDVIKRGINLWPQDDKLTKVLASIAAHPNYYRKAMDVVREELKRAPHNQELLKIRQMILAEVEKRQYSALMLLDYEGYYKFGSKEEIIDYWIDVEMRLLSPVQGSRVHLMRLLLLMQMSLVETMQDRLHLMKVQAKWGEKFTEIFKKKDIKLKVWQGLANKTRIGIVGSHFADNYVGSFIRQLVEHFDQDKIELFCYSLATYENDAMQKYVAEKSDVFKQFTNDEKDEDVAQSIADDGVDALIEIGTFFHRTGVIVHKPAPVVISWLDYPNSSGLPIDYMVVDPYTNPVEKGLLLEKPLILPKTWVAIDQHRIMQAAINSFVPEDRNGYITFGAMSKAFKITIEVFKTWAEIMHMVPNSKFLYVGLEVAQPIFQANFCKNMRKFGIGADRLILIYSAARNVCGHYNDIDIVLDAFPRTGGTTTCEALWMGVPVVALVGPALYERISYSNLSNAGLGELCAFTPQEYKDIALQLVKDKGRRRYLRQNLRQQILNNPLGKPKEFAIDMGNSILKILNKD